MAVFRNLDGTSQLELGEMTDGIAPQASRADLVGQVVILSVGSKPVLSRKRFASERQWFPVVFPLRELDAACQVNRLVATQAWRDRVLPRDSMAFVRVGLSDL
jgi:hypothetical protein